MINFTRRLGLLSLLSMLSIAGNLIADCCCPPLTVTLTQADITPGYTITQSNTTYCFSAPAGTNPITFAGAPEAAAITIAAGVQDIVIDFNGNILQLQNGVEIGIQFAGVTTAPNTNVVIKNGTIQGNPLIVTQSSFGIAFSLPATVSTPINIGSVLPIPSGILDVTSTV